MSHLCASAALTLPLSPDDPQRLIELSERWNLERPIARLVDTLTRLC